MARTDRAMTTKLRQLADLKQVRADLAERALVRAQQAQALAEQHRRTDAARTDFNAQMDTLGVERLGPHARVHKPAPALPARPLQRERDEEQVLLESVSDDIDVDSLLETDESLSFRRAGIGPDALRKLRRGGWTI